MIGHIEREGGREWEEEGGRERERGKEGYRERERERERGERRMGDMDGWNEGEREIERQKHRWRAGKKSWKMHRKGANQERIRKTEKCEKRSKDKVQKERA